MICFKLEFIHSYIRDVYIYIYLYTNVIYVSGYIPVHTEFIVEKAVISFGTSFI